MKIVKLIIVIISLNSCLTSYSQFNFQRSWGTYFGDERFRLSDSKIDNDGNLYLVGTIDGSDLTNLPVFTNQNAHQAIFGGGSADGFIAKFNQTGDLIWGTFLGGDNTDKIGGIDIDKQNNIYILGSTFSTTNIATPNSYQETYSGNGDYFISKFNPSGTLIWSTYFGGSGLDFDNIGGFDNYYETRIDIAYDGFSHLYISALLGSTGLGTPGVFQQTNENSNYSISKFDIDGNRQWTTYYGIDTQITTLKANETAVYATGITIDCPPNHSYNTYYGTNGSHQPIPANCVETFLSKFNSNGQREWSTYYGGNSLESVNYNSIALFNTNVFLSGKAQNYNNNEISTSGSFQPSCNNQSNFIAQFNENGTRNWGTYNGNSALTNSYQAPSNIITDQNGNYYNYGATSYVSLASNDAYQPFLNNNYSSDGFVSKFNPSNNRVWSTYYGGEFDERKIHFFPYQDKFYILGITNSTTQIGTANGYQPTKQVFDLVNNTQQSAYNIFIAHFEPTLLSNESFIENSFSIFPNPNNGSFFIRFPEQFPAVSIKIMDALGKCVHKENNISSEHLIQAGNLAKGMYFVQINHQGGTTTKKLIVE